MTVGERIKEKRLALNMSQEELAKKVGYKSRSSIQKIESARNLPLKKVRKMASALDCTPAYLMGWEDNIISGHSPEVIIRTSDLIQGTYQPYDPEEVEKAMEIYKRYVDLIPEIQAAVDGLLNHRSDA